MSYSVPMVLLERGETKNKRSYERYAETLGEAAQVSEPDERGVFAVVLDMPDEEAALKRAWNAVAVSQTTDNITLLDRDDLPEGWRHLAGPPRRLVAD
jgi:hypothetical protein